MINLLKVAVTISKNRWSLCKCFSQAASNNTCSSTPDVPGLSKKIVSVPENEEVGPGASKDGIYKNAEYYCYGNLSYFEAEIEMKKFRLPQPSSKKV